MTDRPGYLALRVTGKDAARAFKHEAGGHRWQRVSPTEKRGRVHTSTVTVAVLEEPSEAQLQLPEKELDIKTTRGSGAGGQHRNKTDSAVVITHKPTGLMVRVESERSQFQNKAAALTLLRVRLQERANAAVTDKRNSNRKEQVGSGMRGDKRRTIAVQRDSVIDHETGKTTSVKRYLRGFLEDLW